MRSKMNFFYFFRHFVLIIGAVFFFLPFFWMIVTSLKPVDEIFSNQFSIWPQKLALIENYSQALHQVPLLLYLWNGVIVCCCILLLQILVALPAAFVFAKVEFTGKKFLWKLVMLALLIPFQATAIPLYLMMYQVSLLNTLAVLIIPFSISAFGIFLMRQYFKSVPDDLIYAARLDGMGEFELVWRIMLPTAIPALLAFSIFSVVAHWNDYFWPLLVITNPDLATPPLGTMFFRNEESGTQYGPLMAGTVLITAPLTLLFLIAQKRFIEGVTLTGVKG